MSSYRVRSARTGDISAILDLAVEMVLHSRSDQRPGVPDQALLAARRHNLSQLETILDLPEGGLFVAVDDRDRPIGHVILLGNNIDSVTELTQAWVYDISVQPLWWGRGVGKSLMEAAEAFARRLGLEWIGLGVTVANQRAIAFYEEIGYHPERIQMVKKLQAGSPT